MDPTNLPRSSKHTPHPQETNTDPPSQPVQHAQGSIPAAPPASANDRQSVSSIIWDGSQVIWEAACSACVFVWGTTRLCWELMPKRLIKWLLIVLFVLLLLIAAFSLILIGVTSTYCSVYSKLLQPRLPIKFDLPGCSAPNPNSDLPVVSAHHTHVVMQREDFAGSLPDAFGLLGRSLLDLGGGMANLDQSSLPYDVDFDLESADWVVEYQQGIEWASEIEAKFVEQKRESWNRINDYIAAFPSMSYDRDQQSPWDIFGWWYKDTTQACIQRIQRLHAILAYDFDNTSGWVEILPANHMQGDWRKIYSRGAADFAVDVQEVLAGVQAEPAARGLHSHAQIQEITANAALWTGARDLIGEKIDERSRRIGLDKQWLIAKGHVLRRQREVLEGWTGRMNGEEWLRRIQEVDAETITIATDWRARMNEYFMERA